MPGEKPTKLSASIQLVQQLWELRLSVRQMRERGVQLQALMLQDLPSRYPNVNPELLAKLAKAGDDLCTEVIPAYEQRYRKLVFSAVRSAPRILFEPMEPTVPPDAACFLLDLLLAKADREVIPGDVVEEFRAKLAKYGPIRARCWFWVEAARIIVIRNPVCRWALLGGLTRLAEWLFRQIGG
jgi:hypothetical protein